MTAAREPMPVEAPTERRHPGTLDLDLLPTLDLLRLINGEDALVAPAVEAALPAIASAVELAVDALGAGGSVHYFGAGTSGRIAAMDAAELPPTFGLAPGRFVAHHAGGADALDTALEDVEDDGDSGAADAGALSAGDVAIALTASGRTPYVAGALREARRVGAHTVLVSANPAAEVGRAGRRTHLRGDRPGGAGRLHPDEGGHRPEAGAQHLLHRDHGAARAHLLQPDDQRGREEREAARPDGRHPGRGQRPRPRHLRPGAARLRRRPQARAGAAAR